MPRLRKQDLLTCIPCYLSCAASLRPRSKKEATPEWYATVTDFATACLAIGQKLRRQFLPNSAVPNSAVAIARVGRAFGTNPVAGPRSPVTVLLRKSGVESWVQIRLKCLPREYGAIWVLSVGRATPVEIRCVESYWLSELGAKIGYRPARERLLIRLFN